MRKKIILFIALLVLIPSVLFFITTRHSATASLNFITKWGSFEGYSVGSSNGKFTNPYGIAMDSAGDIYVVDTGNNRVQEFHSDGSYVTQWGSAGSGDGQFTNPRGIAVDSSGNVYVIDYSNDTVQEFDSSGTHLNTITNGFLHSSGVAVDSSGNVYVADWSHGAVQEFGSDGSYITQWGVPNSPTNITVDSSGNVYVSSQQDSNVYEFDNSGNLITQWGSYGSGDGLFIFPEEIAVDSSGNVYVVDSGNNRIEKFDSGGNYLSKLGYFLPTDGTFNTPQGIAVDSSGNVYVADTQNDRIEKFDNSGTYLAQWGTPGAEDSEFTNPYSLAVGPGPSGNIYVTDTDNNRIEEFDSGGGFIGTWGLAGGGNSQFNSPKGVAVDSSGNVYVADTGNDRIQEFKSDGSYITQWGSVGSNTGQFNHPIGIAIDSAGNFYVADSGNGRVQKFNASSNYVNQWVVSSSITGIGVDTTGNVYVVDSGNNKVQEFSSSGVFISYIGGLGTGNGQFDSPSGVAFDSSGNLFVVDTNNNRIQKFSVNLDLGLYLSSADVNFYRGSNTVHSLLQVGSTLYLGGSFGLEAVDLTTGQEITWAPGLPDNGGGTPQVFSLAYSATNNILYVGSDNGLFEYDTSAGTGTLISEFAPVFAENGVGSPTIHALSIIGNTLYVGGSFTSIDSTNARVNLASYDISNSTPVLNSWEDAQGTNPEGTVYAFTASNTELFVGGNFSTVEGVSQPAIAAFDLTSGSLVNSFISGFGNSDIIQTLAYDNKVYAGGSFTSVSGSTFENLVSLNEANGQADPLWVPNTQGPVSAMAIKNNYIYVGGEKNGGSRGFAEAYNTQNSNPVDWYPEDTQPVQTMLTTDPAIYVGLNTSGENTRRETNPNKNFAAKNNVNGFNIVSVAQAAETGNLNGNLLADIGGLPGTIYLAKFDAIPPPTVTLTPTETPTPTSAPVSTSSNPSAPVCSDQKPGIPTNAKVVAGPGAQQATLSWTAPTGPVTDYSIIYSNDPNVKKWGVVSTGNVTTYIISNLPLNQNYYFWINAVNGCMPGDPVSSNLLLSGTGSSSAALSGVVNAGNNTSVATQTANSTLPPLSPLPPTGPEDAIKIGVVGVVLTILGGALLLAL